MNHDFSHDFRNSRLAELAQQYKQGSQIRDNRDNMMMHWIYLPAILFSLLGLLFAINFGITLVAIAAAILVYSRFGQKIAAQLGAMLLVMLAIWMLLMPAHHLVAASLGIFLLAVSARFFGQIRATGQKPSLAEWRRYLLSGPVYALVMIREQAAINKKLGKKLGKKLAENPGLDPS